MAAVTLSTCVQKGGAGKTTITGSLATTLAREGNRCLILSCDPQQSIDAMFFAPEVIRATPIEATIAALFGEGVPPEAASLIRPTSFAGISMLPGSSFLARHDLPEPWLCEDDQQRALRDFVEEVRPHFDYIIADCPPTLRLSSWAALQASDFILSPLQAESFSAQGIASTIEIVDAVRANGNPGLASPLYILNMHNPRLSIHRAYEHMFRQWHESAVCETVVPMASEIKESAASRKSIYDLKPRGTAVKAFQELAGELLAKFAASGKGGTQDDRRVA